MMVPETQVAQMASPHFESVEHLKNQFLASLNHEIRTPLSGIIGMTDLLLETTLDGEQKEYVSATRICAESLLEILNATLEYSALASGSPVLDQYEFSLSEALEMAVAEHVTRARAKGLRLYLTYDESLPETMLGDARRLRQMISQLIANAVKFTNGGHIEVIGAPDAGQLKITVRDTGIGIAPEKMSVIFDSFDRWKAGWTALIPALDWDLRWRSASQRSLEETFGRKARWESGAPSRFEFLWWCPRNCPRPVR